MYRISENEIKNNLARLLHFPYIEDLMECC